MLMGNATSADVESPTEAEPRGISILERRGEILLSGLGVLNDTMGVLSDSIDAGGSGPVEVEGVATLVVGVVDAGSDEEDEVGSISLCSSPTIGGGEFGACGEMVNKLEHLF